MKRPPAAVLLCLVAAAAMAQDPRNDYTIGGWPFSTGSVAAILFGIKPRYAFPAIVLGVTVAGIVVSCFVSLFG